MVERYAAAGYSGFVLTDHYNRAYMDRYGISDWDGKLEHFLDGYRRAKARGDAIGFTVLLGAELALDGSANEYLLYGLTEEFLRVHPELYARTQEEVRRLADANDILIVQAHPYRPGLTRASAQFLDGVEVYNGNPRHHSQNPLARQYAAEQGLLCSSGSDAHQVEDIARGGLETTTRIESLAQLQAAIRAGEPNGCRLICTE